MKIKKLKSFINGIVVAFCMALVFGALGSSNVHAEDQYTGNLIPTMTSNTSPSGVASASSIYGVGFEPYRIFDENYSDDWISANETTTGWIAYEFASPKKIEKYTLKIPQEFSQVVGWTPKNWTFEGFDGNSWVVLDTQTNVIVTDWIGGVNKEYTFSNANYYKKYRLNVSANNGHRYVALYKLEMMEKIQNNNKVLNIEPEKNKIKLNETVSANLTIDNIKDIAAEDVKIKYDSTKLQFLGAAEVDGIKLVKNDAQPGELRVIVASKGVANVVNAKKALLKLNFKGIAAGDALVDVTKGRVSDGIDMEKDLTDEQCGQATITIEDSVLKDVNNSGEFTLLDLGIDGRHYSEDPTTLTQYNTDIVANKAIDDDDLTKIGEYMLANPNYKF